MDAGQGAGAVAPLAPAGWRSGAGAGFCARAGTCAIVDAVAISSSALLRLLPIKQTQATNAAEPAAQPCHTSHQGAPVQRGPLQARQDGMNAACTHAGAARHCQQPAPPPAPGAHPAPHLLLFIQSLSNILASFMPSSTCTLPTARAGASDGQEAREGTAWQPSKGAAGAQRPRAAGSTEPTCRTHEVGGAGRCCGGVLNVVTSPSCRSAHRACSPNAPACFTWFMRTGSRCTMPAPWQAEQVARPVPRQCRQCVSPRTARKLAACTARAPQWECCLQVALAGRP